MTAAGGTPSSFDARFGCLVFVATVLVGNGAAGGASLPCLPCIGVRAAGPEELLEALERGGELGPETYLLASFDIELDQRPSGRSFARIRELGALPAPRLLLRTPAPVRSHLDVLTVELEATAAVGASLAGEAWVQIEWQPSAGDWSAADYAFLLKRAAAAISGAEPRSLVLTAALPNDPAILRELWGEEISAYIDGAALAPASTNASRSAIATLAQLDPGRAVFIDTVALPEQPLRLLAEAASHAGLGADGIFFDIGGADLVSLEILRAMAIEFQGDIALDPSTVPSGAASAWSFVRGDDLSLRVIVDQGPDIGARTLRFPDPYLRRVRLVDPRTGARSFVPASRLDDALEITIDSPDPVLFLSLERMTAAEIEGLEGLEEELAVAGSRTMPVEEILSRLQAVEDAQSRRLRHYSAINTSHLRFQLGGVQSIEVTFRGEFFYRPPDGFDWAWQDFLFNGVRWRGKRIPEIPLIQPERAAALPLEIHFSREYRYRLRGTATVRGRDCWVVEFRPAVASPGRNLHQGTVWIDRQHFFRVRTRAIQVGLQGDVLSNEETVDYSPLDELGEAAPWTTDSYFLPTRVVGQQLFSILNATVVVESETELAAVRINSSDFDESRNAVLASEATMVRDTENGLRYLVKDADSGERIVQEKPRTGRLFGAAGILWDESLEYPVPLIGIDYFSFDFRDTGIQLNGLAAGPLLIGNLADPTFLGSRWDVGVDVFFIALKGSDTFFVGDTEIPQAEVRVRPASIDFSLGHPIGAFGKIDLGYHLAHVAFSPAESTADQFVVPSDHTTQSFSLTGRYNRSGYRFRLGGSYNQRSEWQPWGLAGNPDYDPEKKDFTLWRAAIAKIWHLPRFQKVGVEIEYVDGDSLDRFSKIEFGLFSDIRVHGYQSNKVRAEQALATHFSYGFDIGEILRVDLVGDAAWATDEATLLDNELLAGVGVVGTFMGPWSTIVNIDLGVAVAGPDDGVGLMLTFLKLFGPP